LQTAVSERSDTAGTVPTMMKAAVYQGNSSVTVESLPTPLIAAGDLLVRVEACGICHTDLKKIEYDLLPAPRIFGHETAGTVVAVGENVKRFQVGDRVIAFHHVPCLNCFYCTRKLYAQCSTYQKVGISAGFEPSGGGFAQYIRIMDWIVDQGVEKIPDGVSFERACLVEPLNTCLKAVEMADPQPTDTVVILGQGPIGLMFTMLVNLTGAKILATDTIAKRRELSVKFGAKAAWNPKEVEVEEAVRILTEGRGADIVIVAASASGIVDQAMRCSRAGSKILLFSQTSDKERVEISGADICKGERTLFGSYSASIDLQKKSADLVFSGKLPLEDLITHRLPLNQIRQGIHLALHPDEASLKIIVQTQRWSA